MLALFNIQAYVFRNIWSIEKFMKNTNLLADLQLILILCKTPGSTLEIQSLCLQ